MDSCGAGKKSCLRGKLKTICVDVPSSLECDSSKDNKIPSYMHQDSEGEGGHL